MGYPWLFARGYDLVVKSTGENHCFSLNFSSVFLSIFAKKNSLIFYTFEVLRCKRNQSMIE
jgi:hypothetical protein